MKEHVRKAEEVLRGSITERPFLLSDCAEALDAAGLLRTGIEQEACAACEQHAQTCGEGLFVFPAARRVNDLGRRIAEERKPKERWVVKQFERGWQVQDSHTGTHHSFGTEAECRAVAEALNKLEAR